MTQTFLRTPETNKVRIAGCLLLALLCASAASAEETVYRTVDANGNVVYSDRPLNDRSELVRVTTGGGTASTGAAFASRAPAPAATTTSDIQAPAPPPPLPEGPTAAEMREQRLKNCEVARERQARYAISPRLYRQNEAGERVYLSEAEMEEARARAAEDVQNWCG